MYNRNPNTFAVKPVFNACVDLSIYAWPASCSNCFDYSRDSKMKKESLDSLVALFGQIPLNDITSKVFFPSNHYFGKGSTSTPHIIKTFYRIDGNKAIPLHQIKTTFYERPGKNPGIISIEILNGKAMKIIDSKIVIASYKQQLKADQDKTAPPIQKSGS